MTISKITEKHLQKSAIVYIRQSSLEQVRNNRESLRLQYDLADRAKRLGFQRITVIADDLGRSATGVVDRPGFERLVATICEGQVGAVLCLQASRLARNGREWHYLIDFCGLVGTLIIDLDGIYDPSISNDRLLLGVKGTLNEFEVNQLRQRSTEAIRFKAARGELQFALPVGLMWSDDGRVEPDPDRRVRESLRLVFRKFGELRSVRQVLMWFAGEEISLPRLLRANGKTRTEWKPPRYHTVLHLIRNPAYAGVYAFGRTGSRTLIIDGRPRRSGGHDKPRDQWLVRIPGHHPGYISLEEYERNQIRLAENTHM
jgi:DNA invertase Pin-like site-specific DNA recombinase